MTAFPWGALVGAAGSLVGDLFQGNANEKAAKQANAIAKKNMEMQEGMNKKNLMFALMQNKNKVQWTVADAKKAGIHPLAALGSPVSGSWAQWQGQAPQMEYTAQASNTGSAVGNALGKFGQAMQEFQIASAATEFERQRIQLEKERLELLGAATSRSAIMRAEEAGPTRFAGMDFEKSGAFDDAQKLQDRWGEWAEWVFGPFIFAGDAGKTAVGSAAAQVEKYQEEVQRRMRERGYEPY